VKYKIGDIVLVADYAACGKTVCKIHSLGSVSQLMITELMLTIIDKNKPNFKSDIHLFRRSSEVFLIELTSLDYIIYDIAD
jgi:hypothetical protein